MSDQPFPVLPAIAEDAHVDPPASRHGRAREADPEVFGPSRPSASPGSRRRPRSKHGDFTGDVHVKWYEDGTLNASAVCLDRHLQERPDQVAIIWEGDDPGTQSEVTYRELHEQVCRLANALSPSESSAATASRSTCRW